MNHGFLKVAAAIPSVRVADCAYNTEQIKSLIMQAEQKGAEIVVFPELCVTGYTCQDLFQSQQLLDDAEIALISLLDYTRSYEVIVVIGLPVPYQGSLLNCAAVLQRGKLLGMVPKTYLPNYKEFYEQRWFTSANDIRDGIIRCCGQQIPITRRQLFRTPSCVFAIEICEDLWAPNPPSTDLCMLGADVILNLSASDDSIGKYPYLRSLVTGQSARCICGYVFTGCGFGESTQDVVFSGKSIIAENGNVQAEALRHQLTPQLTISDIDIQRLRTERRINTTFAACASSVRDLTFNMVDTELTSQRNLPLDRNVDPYPFVPKGRTLDERCEEIFEIQCEGLAKRIMHTNAETVTIGISGGLDSTLALLVCERTFRKIGRDLRGIVGITMPGFGTTDRTYTNAVELMKNLGITIREIDIQEACRIHFRDIAHDPNIHDVTYENSQARERTQILMDAANQMNGFVVGTGDLSELALGWATYNGDHMSMYGVNVSVPKTLVRHLVTWVANNVQNENTRAILLDIVDTPISPELIPADIDGNIAQKTEDLVGPYDLHDFFLYYTLRWGYRPDKTYFLACKAFDGRFTHEEIKKWLTVFFRRFFAQQFKRSCLPDGPKVGSCSLSPRGDWRMPSDASSASWLKTCESIRQLSFDF